VARRPERARQGRPVADDKAAEAAQDKKEKEDAEHEQQEQQGDRAEAPGTVIVNSITVGSAVTDPTAANNTATTNTTVTSPSQADLSISKSASPDPVNQGDTLVYTLTIANNGPASAASVVVTDPLPTAVTYISSSATQGTCSQAAGTVTCNIGTMSNGQIVTVTINATATTMSTSSYAVNTASVSSVTSDPDNTNNSSTFTSTVAAPNAVPGLTIPSHDGPALQMP